ncbi:c-type cytochrome [Antarctobacter jejuensis]|uniref:c-type cytochrome n=1 Tax=Antarctobacter jejuensis TaxID=1439938 RepID=UPI003FD37E39
MMKSTVLTVSMICFGVSAWAESHATEATEVTEADAVTIPEEVDLAAAEKVFRKTCRACHGNKAQGVASYPKLSDKEPEYIAEKLEIYRSGEKIGPNSILMIQHAKKLSDEDIANLSVYVATAFD